MATCESSGFVINSVVRGYNVYKDIWTSARGEELQCQRETGNVHDLYAVSVMQRGNTVGHFSRKISTVCNLFIRQGGTITYMITGNRQYSADLPQGALEIPCQCVFNGNNKVVHKAQKMLQQFTADSTAATAAKTEVTAEVKLEPQLAGLEPTTVYNVKVNPSEEILVEISSDEEEVHCNNVIWVEIDRLKLYITDKNILCTPGRPLTDKHINYAQVLLRKKFPSMSGLQSTLQQYKELAVKMDTGVQIIHCHGYHWVTAHKYASDIDVVQIYDSMYDTADDVKTIVLNLFVSLVRVKMAKIQKQQPNSNNCGLFAITIATTISFKTNPEQSYKESEMRQHLLQCFEKGAITLFPNTSSS